MAADKHRFPLRMSEELFNEVEAEAAREMRSANVFINIAIKEHLKKIKEDEAKKKS